MIKFATTLGSVTLTNAYFANLVGCTASSCYGVKGMATSGPAEGLRAVLFGDNFPELGVRVYEQDKKLEIELHIKVVYGVNISAIVDSIANKVKYAVEQATGLTVGGVNVYVDELVTEE
ncbi:MAG: Asp23/Gls24 family envelope stress response protein [Oscillospiraceae bacterium]|nr:Asp23/Gls24 family envelope stress response protein [Oscillospiraceae bacterium]